MKRTTIAAVAALSLMLGASSVTAERGGRQAVPLLGPENVMCTIDGAGGILDVSWDAVAGATKYAVDFECEDPTGTMELGAEYEPDERLIDTFAMVPFDVLPLEVILEGDGAWSCMVKVKGLNPPGRKQAHEQGVALCQ